MFLTEIAGAGDLGAAAALHQRLAKVAKSVLDSGEVRNATTRAELRNDVTINVIAAMEKYEEDARFDNYRCLEPLLRQIDWFSPEEDAVRQIWDAKMTFNSGNARVAEFKMRELLDLAKQRKWADAKRAASRALASINK